MREPFYTIGHSTRSIPEFVGLLRIADITLVVDIRTVRRSRANPQFNSDALPESLSAAGIGYEHIDELGGLRGKAKDIPPSLNAFWINQSFHSYADYALSAAFFAGLDRLVTLGRQNRSAILCAETLWWRCHRRIVADYLISRGETVFHLMGNDKIEPAKLTDGVTVRDDGALVYPPSHRARVSDRRAWIPAVFCIFVAPSAISAADILAATDLGKRLLNAPMPRANPACPTG